MSWKLGNGIRFEVTNRFVALKNLSNGEENIKESMKTSAKESLGLPELKQHKPWFDKECVGCSGKRKQANTQWVQDPNPSKVD